MRFFLTFLFCLTSLILFIPLINEVNASDISSEQEIYFPGDKITLNMLDVDEPVTIQINKEEDILLLQVVEPSIDGISFSFMIPHHWNGTFHVWFAGELAYDDFFFEVKEKTDESNDTPISVPIGMPVIGFIAVLSVGGGIGVLSTEAGKYKALMFFVPLFSRLRDDDILNQETRWKIMGAVYAQPGIRYSELKRVLNLENGTLIHHTHILIRNKKIVTRLDGANRRYFSISMKKQSAAMVPGPSLKRIQIEIMAFIEEYPGFSQKQISHSLRMKQSNLSYHLRQLEEKKYIEVVKGRSKRYFLRGGPLSYSCERCHNQFSSEKIPKFCPNCGHSLDKENNPNLNGGILVEEPL